MRLLSPPVRVHVVDPSAYTPPYDDALCAALARAGAHVELYTSRFAYGPVAHPHGYQRHETFYRRAHRTPASGARGRAQLALKLAEHVPDMLRYRRRAGAADVVHFQWVTVQPLDVHLLPGGRPLVLTAHDVLPREPRPGQVKAQSRLYQRMHAIVVHSEHGRRRLEELGVERARIHVIPHGSLARPVQSPLPPELRAVSGPVVLWFGLLRPYKGLDVLLEAWGGIEGAELWIVGMPRMDVERLRAAAPAGVRFRLGFVPDAQVGAYFERADLVALPYREIDQSGVALTALASGTPLVLSDVGGFSELAALGCARLVPAGDAAALHHALVDLLASPDVRSEMSRRALQAAAGPFSWERIAGQTLGLYRSLLQQGAD
jgi:glycosyltransferase involved in cell wall biosynthesis